MFMFTFRLRFCYINVWSFDIKAAKRYGIALGYINYPSFDYYPIVVIYFWY